MPPNPPATRAIPDGEFDVLVIGGGITGAGIARDAARRGLRTILLEREDFASGTSSRSSRLVHGGVRYLEHGWLHLVFEASRERRRLLETAPHLVRPLQFTWPVYEHQRLARWEIGAGLALYDVLALYRNVGRHKRLSAEALTAREPELLGDGLLGGATYWDAATDDARLTLAVALDAERAGAVIRNHVAVTGFTRSGTRVDGVVAQDALAGRECRVRARTIVNATGPWSDDVHRWEDADSTASVRGTKGVHVLVERNRVGVGTAVTLLHPRDQRVMFVIPSGDFAIIGTTDTETASPPDQVRADASDIAYLLEATNHFFPAARLDRERDVIAAWAGIRPLIASRAGVTPSSSSREHEVAVGSGGVISISGGKLTTYRSMAEEVVDVVVERLGVRARRCDTADAPVAGGAIDDVATLTSNAADRVGDERIAARLVRAHGSDWHRVWALAESEAALRAPLFEGSDVIAADLVWSALHEHAHTLSDLLIRRTHIAFETRDHGLRAADVCASVLTTARVLTGARMMAAARVWDAGRNAVLRAEYGADVARLFSIDLPPTPRRSP